MIYYVIIRSTMYYDVILHIYIYIYILVRLRFRPGRARAEEAAPKRSSLRAALSSIRGRVLFTCLLFFLRFLFQANVLGIEIETSQVKHGCINQGEPLV